MLKPFVVKKLASSYAWSKISVRARTSGNAVRAYWWDAETNFGDLVTQRYLAEVTGHRVVNVNGATWDFGNAICGAGSLLGSLSYPNLTIWGSGFINKTSSAPRCAPAHVLAYRGPRSAFLASRLGWPQAALFGDPGVLVPRLFPQQSAPEYRLGIIPHISHDHYVEHLRDKYTDLLIIPANRSLAEVAYDIRNCETIISSSLHGIIVARAYDIPTVWLEFPGGLKSGYFKFYDFFESLRIKADKVTISENEINRASLFSLIDYSVISSINSVNEMADGLEKSLSTFLKRRKK